MWFTFFVTTLCLYTLFFVLGKLCFPNCSKTRWFFVHFVANMITCSQSFPSVLFLAHFTPEILKFWVVAKDFFPVYISLATVVAIHIYHVIHFDLTKIDIFHHFVFVPGLIIPAYFSVQQSTKHIILAIIFFMNGFPGGVTYLYAWF